MSAGARTIDLLCWHVLSRSHFFLFVVAAVSIPYWPVKRFLEQSVRHDIWDSLLTALHVLLVNSNNNFLLLAGCCYVLREIALLAVTRQNGDSGISFELRERKVEMIMNRWIEKALMALVFLFITFAIYDVAIAVWKFVGTGFSWRYMIVSFIGSAGTKLFYATVLFFLMMLLSMLRARGENT